MLTPDVVDGLDVRAVVGAANNQLDSRDIAERLFDRDIVWAPDFVANAGGVIYLDLASTPGVSVDELDARVAGIGATIAEVLRSAEQARITTLAAAEALAAARLHATDG